MTGEHPHTRDRQFHMSRNGCMRSKRGNNLQLPSWWDCEWRLRFRLGQCHWKGIPTSDKQQEQGNNRWFDESGSTILLRSPTASPGQRGNWGFPQQPAQGTKAQLSRGKQWRCLSTPVLRRDMGGGLESFWSQSTCKSTFVQQEFNWLSVL